MIFRDKNEDYEEGKGCIYEVKNRKEPEGKEQRWLKELELERGLIG